MLFVVFRYGMNPVWTFWNTDFSYIVGGHEVDCDESFRQKVNLILGGLRCNVMQIREDEPVVHDSFWVDNMNRMLLFSKDAVRFGRQMHAL